MNERYAYFAFMMFILAMLSWVTGIEITPVTLVFWGVVTLVYGWVKLVVSKDHDSEVKND